MKLLLWNTLNTPLPIKVKNVLDYQTKTGYYQIKTLLVFNNVNNYIRTNNKLGVYIIGIFKLKIAII